MIYKKKPSGPRPQWVLLCVFVFVYRAPEPRPLGDLADEIFFADPFSERYDRRDIHTPKTCFSFHLEKRTLHDYAHPLYYQALALSFDLNPNPITVFHCSGGGGYPPADAESGLEDFLKSLMAMFRSFPRGWRRCERYRF